MSAHAGTVLMRNTMVFDRDHTAEFTEAIRNAVSFAEEHAPQLMVHTFIDEAAGRCYSFQLYEDSDAIQRHWAVSDPYISAVMEHCRVESLEIYGDPSDAVRTAILDGMDPSTVSFIGPLTGYHLLRR